ncbi:MAG: family 20 glycosylhydrolase [Victivallales bacterium]
MQQRENGIAGYGGNFLEYGLSGRLIEMQDNGDSFNHVQPFRGVHYDLARGNYDSLESLRSLVRFTAECGLNEIVLYMEDLWKFRRHPQLSGAHAYKMEDMRQLAEYARTQGIDFIPSLTTMGHSRHILEKPKYRHLAFPNSVEFNILNPAVYELFDDIFQEVLPCFSSSYVFINGDEMNLSQLDNRAKDVVRERGMGALYGQAMGRIAHMVLKYGRRPIMWHDMLFHHPEGMDYLPKETIIAYWFYDHQPNFPAVPYLCCHGFDVIAAPAVSPGHNMRADYARTIPNIEGQVKGAARFIRPPRQDGVGRNGICLGTMTTIWERTRWKDSTLGIYATGQWSRNPKLKRKSVLSHFARDVFGLSNPALGEAWCNATLEGERLLFWRTALMESRCQDEKRILSGQLKMIEGRLKKQMAAISCSKAARNQSLHQHMKQVVREALAFRPTKSLSPLEPELIIPSLIDASDHSCRIIELQTKFGHRLVVLTNGLIAIGILPDFGATMIEWVLLGENPWSAISHGYQQWASNEFRIPGNPSLGSPWGANSIGGWRETIFFNARLNPSSLWGRPFALKVKECDGGEVSVECVGQNEIAEVRRIIRIERGCRTIAIDTQATNRLEACCMALQPNVTHYFPRLTSPLLRLREGNGGRMPSRYLLENDGTKLLEPQGGMLRVEMPPTGRFIQLRFRRAEVKRFFIDAGVHWFTLEPFGVVRIRKKGESVRMRLEYEIGDT